MFQVYFFIWSLFILHCSPPQVNRATKPIDHFTSTGAHSTNAYGLRDVYIPAELMVKFFNLAQPNTTNNIETCGIICGKLVRLFTSFFLSVW